MFQINTIFFNNLIKKIILILLYIMPLVLFSQFLLNLYIILFCLLFFAYTLLNKSFSWIKDRKNILLIFFGIYILFQSIFFATNSISLIKSLFYFKFIIYFISVTFFLKNFNIELKNLFKIYLIILFLFSSDLLFQFFFKKNLIGYPCLMDCTRYPGMFEDEMIAGGYLFLFGFISSSYFLINKNYKLFSFSFLIFSISIFLTGDRTPFFSILFLIFFNILLNTEIRKKLFLILVGVAIVFLMSAYFSEKIQSRYIQGIKNILNSSELTYLSLNQGYKKMLEDLSEIKKIEEKYNLKSDTLNFLENDKKFLESFLYMHLGEFFDQKAPIYQSVERAKTVANQQIIQIQKRMKNVLRINKIRGYSEDDEEKKFIYSLYDTTYGAHFLTAFEIMKENPLFGSGLKSFRLECHKYNNINSLIVSDRCTTHPHNFYFEILSEVGIIGFMILSCIIFIFLKNYFNNKNVVNTFLICIFLVIIFPLKPTGSFFSSWTGFIFWTSFAFTVFSVNTHNYAK